MDRADYRFADRAEAGRLLAKMLGGYADRPDVLVLALPRGGVPVAFEIASGLRAPLDVFLVRKLGAPGYPELAMGAIATGGVRVIEPDTVRALRVSQEAIDRVVAEEQRELERREQIYRGDLFSGVGSGASGASQAPPAPLDVCGRVVIVVDDGMATGSTMLAAVLALRKLAPARIVVAVPVAPPSVCDEFREEADDVVCALTPEPFEAVGAWYQNFPQTTDAEVRELLARASQKTPSRESGTS